MKHPVYLVGFRVRKEILWVATDRADLTAAEIAFIYSLRWDIEKLFSWWKRHLKVYHLISRDRHGMLLQLLAGLITYLLLALYCYQFYGERQPSIRRLRELRRHIRRETGEIMKGAILPESMRIALLAESISRSKEDIKYVR